MQVRAWHIHVSHIVAVRTNQVVVMTVGGKAETLRAILKFRSLYDSLLLQELQFPVHSDRIDCKASLLQERVHL